MSLRGVGRKTELRCKGVARVVISIDVRVAQAEHVFRVNVGALNCRMRFLKKGDGLSRPTLAIQGDAMHLNRLPIAGILLLRLGKCCDRLSKLIFLIKDDAAQALDAGWLGILGR